MGIGSNKLPSAPTFNPKLFNPALTKGLEGTTSTTQKIKIFTENVKNSISIKIQRLIHFFQTRDWVNNKNQMRKMESYFNDLTNRLKIDKTLNDIDLSIINGTLSEMESSCQTLRESGADSKSISNVEGLLQNVKLAVGTQRTTRGEEVNKTIAKTLQATQEAKDKEKARMNSAATIIQAAFHDFQARKKLEKKEELESPQKHITATLVEDDEKEVFYDFETTSDVPTGEPATSVAEEEDDDDVFLVAPEQPEIVEEPAPNIEKPKRTRRKEEKDNVIKNTKPTPPTLYERVGKVALVCLGALAVAAVVAAGLSLTGSLRENSAITPHEFSPLKPTNFDNSHPLPPVTWDFEDQQNNILRDTDFNFDAKDYIRDVLGAVSTNDPQGFQDAMNALKARLPKDPDGENVIRATLDEASKIAESVDDPYLSTLIKKSGRSIDAAFHSTSPSIETYLQQGRPSDYKNPNICVFTSYTANTPERRQMSKMVAENQRAYSNAKGYTYLEYEENLAVDKDPYSGKEIFLEPYWSKIAGINRILNNQESSIKKPPEWIVWMDDDAIISNPDFRFEDVLHHYTSDQEDLNFIVTTDSMSHVIRDIPLNSAVLFIKNNEWSRDFFRSVWEMRNERVPGQSYTYGNCPNQSCLHEQQAITNLLFYNRNFANHARIIPQRDVDDPVGGWGINTFTRGNHFDLNRQMVLNYSNDRNRGRALDFIQQCTGLATRGYWLADPHQAISNLRLDCVKHVLGETYDRFPSFFSTVRNV